MLKLSGVVHPEHVSESSLWAKWRLVLEGGDAFIEDYLKKYSTREDDTAFEDRKDLTPSSAFAKAAILDIRNEFFPRTVDVVRTGGSKSYQDAIRGLNGGVDLDGRTMGGFVGGEILLDLLAMGKVGVYIDKAAEQSSLVEKTNPYVYTFPREDIMSWSYGADGRLDVLLLREHYYDMNELGLPKGIKEGYRYLERKDGVVEVTLQRGKVEETTQLKINQIPFVIFEISDSLLTDVSNYQIAIMNMASSDIDFAVKANFTFYTEQFDSRAENSQYMMQPVDAENTETSETADRKASVSPTTGRRYGKDLERPGFINPSPEPLVVSMQKQAELKADIRSLLLLAITNLESKRASAESKEADNRSLEAGLSYIGDELEYGESRIANIWAAYEGTQSDVTVKYPRQYHILTDEQRRAEGKELEELIPTTPSDTFRKEITKEVVNVTIGHKIPKEKLAKIHSEIDASQVMITDPETIKADHEAGFVSDETASKIRGYADGEVAQARLDHAARIARIQAAQSSDGGARGVPDQQVDPDDGKKEKEVSRQNDLNDTPTDKTRGDGK